MAKEIETKQKKKKEPEVNKSLLNIITPSGIDVASRNANLGNNYGQIYVVNKFPNGKVNYGWLASLSSLDGTSTTLEYRYSEPDIMISVYDKKLSELKGSVDELRNESAIQSTKKKIKDLENMIKRVKINNEPIGYVTILLHVQAPTQKDLAERVRRVSQKVAVAGCNLILLTHNQLRALKSTSPYGLPDSTVSNYGERNMTMSTFLGGYPMASSGLNDEKGFYLGKTKNNKLVIVDIWERGGDRINSNWFISGDPGSGKSTTLKLLFTKEIAFGTKFIVLDPEREYLDLAKHPDIDGEIIDCSGGKNGRINPLQIRPAPVITKEDIDEKENINDFISYEDEELGSSEMAQHIQSLRIFFKLYFGAENYTIDIKSRLEYALEIMYNKFNISWETDVSKLENKDFPILSDLYEVVEEEIKKDNLTNYHKEAYAKLLDLLRPISKGADKFSWNGHTTIETKTNFVDLNVNGLLDCDSNVKNAQFFNMISWAWQRISKDRNEKIILGVDEGYLFIDPENIELARFLRNISKRARKYEAGLMFITHAVKDLLHEDVSRFGQAIIDTSCFKLILGCDAKNLKDTVELFGLNSQEESIISAKQRGEGIFFAGSKRMQIKIDVRDNFLSMFGSAGGR